MNKRDIEDIVSLALKEDIGFGDLTTDICIAEETIAEAVFIAKEDGVLCGVGLVEEVFRQVDSALEIEFSFKDGDDIGKGTIIGSVKGRAKGILSGERVALNFLQHMSGIATKTQFYVNQVKGFHTKIVDTRKTTPGLRGIEKYAVVSGGGYNHRFSLDAGVLIKDNHIKGAGGIKGAVEKARLKAPHTMKIEVEVGSVKELHDALEAKADIIMLDNMDLDRMKESIDIIGGRALVEASGNMADCDLVAIAGIGVDLISIGGLTNAVKGLDISLKFI